MIFYFCFVMLSYENIWIEFHLLHSCTCRAWIIHCDVNISFLFFSNFIRLLDMLCSIFSFHHHFQFNSIYFNSIYCSFPFSNFISNVTNCLCLCLSSKLYLAKFALYDNKKQLGTEQDRRGDDVVSNHFGLLWFVLVCFVLIDFRCYYIQFILFHIISHFIISFTFISILFRF